MKSDKPHIAVLMGGWSTEREVSLISGDAVAKALEANGYQVSQLDVDQEISTRLNELKPDIAFNALHGRWGEDGCIQGVLELAKIPYSHSGVLASALAMNKHLAKQIFSANGIPCPPGRLTDKQAVIKGNFPKPPFVIKPNAEGSSVGVVIVEKMTNDQITPSETWSDDMPLLVEEYIPGRELTVAVMGDRALAVTELRPHEGFYDYRAKYTEGTTEHLLPAPISGDIADAAMDYALKAHQCIDCRGVTRADFRYDDTADEGLYLIEVNTQPGMTPLSLVPEQAAYCGINFSELVTWMVEDASCQR